MPPQSTGLQITTPATQACSPFCNGPLNVGLTGTTDHAYKTHHSRGEAAFEAAPSLHGQHIEQLISATIFDSTDQPPKVNPRAQYPAYPLGA